MERQQTTSEKRARYFSVFTAILAGLGTLVAALLTSYSNSARDQVLKARDFEARSQLAEVQERFNAQHAELAQEKRQLDERLAATRAEVAELAKRSSATTPVQLSTTVSAQLGEVQAATAKLASQISAATDQSKSLETRLKNLESVILTDPTKALSLPLLQRDLQGLSQQIDRGLASAKADSDRVYDLMKWVLGLMGVVSLSLVGTAVGNVFKRESMKEAQSRGFEGNGQSSPSIRAQVRQGSNPEAEVSPTGEV